jgi:hypothetical protein
VAAADPEWSCMIILALKAGLRQGELLALRREDALGVQLPPSASDLRRDHSTASTERSCTVPRPRPGRTGR